MVERYKSGFQPPADIPFDDLSASGSTSGSDSASVNGSMTSIGGPHGINTPGSVEKKTILGTITGGRVKKRSGLLGLFRDNKVRMVDPKVKVSALS